MKKHLLLLCLLASTLSYLTAQTTIHLTFTGEVNGNHQTLDSVLIQNLSQGGDTTLYGTDTVLVLDHGIGIDDRVPEVGNQMILHPAYPNPVTHTSTIRLWLPQEGPVTMSLFDLPGRELATFNRFLGAGEHSFTFTPGRETSYLLVAEASDQRQVQKLISLRPGNGNSQISYIGHQPSTLGMRKGKSSFPWVPGDDLRFVGYVSVGVDSIEDRPTQSETYMFQFTTHTCGQTVTDINGNVYNTVQIGTQCWMRENLRVQNYRDGTPIPVITSYSGWYGLASGGMCWYNNDSLNYANPYGALYNWWAIAYPNVCPQGWHVPTKTEWNQLSAYLGGYTVAGGHLKDTGTTHWNSPNTGATNQSGFTALPAGSRSYLNGDFSGIGTSTRFWTIDPNWPAAWYISLSHTSSIYVVPYLNMGYGFSVRCVRD
jgi:uncharacterized protein (TIGR02145 family)